MGIFENLKKKEETEELKETINLDDMSLEELNNYILSDVRKNDINGDFDIFPIDKLVELSPVLGEIADNISSVNKANPTKNSKMYKVTNLKGGNLVSNKKGDIYGSIIKKDGTKTMAKFKEVNPNNVTKALNPELLMMTVALSGIEAELGEIKEISKNIMSFLEHDKESEIEADLDILHKSMKEYKYNLNDDTFIKNIHKQIMDIERTQNKNMLFYKKELTDVLTKRNLITTNMSMNSIIKTIKDKFKYYRLSLYIYAYATFSEVIILKNSDTNYLLTKKEELEDLIKDYEKVFNDALDYIKKNASKSLEGNVLSGIGTAGKAIGNLAEKVKVKSVDNWLNEKGDNLKQSGQNIKDDYAKKFEDVKDTYIEKFITGIDRMYNANKSNEIYFDDENVYIRTRQTATK